jgi:serine/threonine protein kinase
VLWALANKAPAPVAEKNTAMPAALADLIMRLLAKAPGERPQSAQDVAESLRRIEREHATVTAQAQAAPARDDGVYRR